MSLRWRIGTSGAVGLVLAAAAGTSLGAVQVVELSAQRPLRRRRRAAAAVGSLVFALAACSSGAAPSDSVSPRADPAESASVAPIASATSSARDLASPSTTPPIGAPRITWSEVEFDGSIADVIGDGARFVAVGTDDSAASAWTSPDGMTWERHGVPEQSFGQFPNGADMTAGMRSLVRLGDTLYSFGATTIFIDSSHGAGWRWTDGQAWEAIQSSSAFFAGEVIAVTASDEALVASTVTFGGPRGTLATWRWTPATSWVRTSLPSDIFFDTLTWADGTFLATGASVADDGQAQPSMWTSADGSDWSSVGIPDGMSSVCSLTSIGTGGFLAFGRAGDRFAAWTSPDGASWVASTIEHADGSGITNDLRYGAACSVVAADDGLVAVMLADDALIWTSRDGASWEFQEELEVSGVRVDATGQVPLAAVGRHVLLADTRTDPTQPGGLRQAVFVGVLEP